MPGRHDAGRPRHGDPEIQIRDVARVALLLSRVGDRQRTAQKRWHTALARGADDSAGWPGWPTFFEGGGQMI